MKWTQKDGLVADARLRLAGEPNIDDDVLWRGLLYDLPAIIVQIRSLGVQHGRIWVPIQRVDLDNVLFATQPANGGLWIQPTISDVSNAQPYARRVARHLRKLVRTALDMPMATRYLLDMARDGIGICSVGRSGGRFELHAQASGGASDEPTVVAWAKKLSQSPKSHTYDDGRTIVSFRAPIVVLP